MAIEVSRSLAGHGQIRRSVVRNVALTALAVALVSALVTTLLGLVLIERPLADLVTQARRVGEGDLSYRIATRRRDEIAGVAQEMNRMCDRLREARESERLQADAKRRPWRSSGTPTDWPPSDALPRAWRTSWERRSTSCRRAPSR